MKSCFLCNKNLTLDEIGLHKKLINKGSSEFMCIYCLGAHFNIKEDILTEKIEYFKKTKCTLFV